MLDLEDWQLREAREWLDVAINKGGIIHLEPLAVALADSYMTRMIVENEPDFLFQRGVDNQTEIL